jgi:hypothetical protein
VYPWAKLATSCRMSSTSNERSPSDKSSSQNSELGKSSLAVGNSVKGTLLTGQGMQLSNGWWLQRCCLSLCVGDVISGQHCGDWYKYTDILCPGTQFRLQPGHVT